MRKRINTDKLAAMGKRVLGDDWTLESDDELMDLSIDLEELVELISQVQKKENGNRKGASEIIAMLANGLELESVERYAKEYSSSALKAQLIANGDRSEEHTSELQSR